MAATRNSEMESIRQTGTTPDYCNVFQDWFKRVQILQEFSDFYGVYLFICGLEPEIREIFVDWHQYSCNRVEDVISLALKIDANGLQDSFSPFDPESSFYKKELEFDFRISLDEIMKDNEFFKSGKIQKVCEDLVQEISNEDVDIQELFDDNKHEVESENMVNAYKVFDKMPMNKILNQDDNVEGYYQTFDSLLVEQKDLMGEMSNNIELLDIEKSSKEGTKDVANLDPREFEMQWVRFQTQKVGDMYGIGNLKLEISLYSIHLRAELVVNSEIWKWPKRKKKCANVTLRTVVSISEIGITNPLEKFKTFGAVRWKGSILSAILRRYGLESVCLKVCTHYPTLIDHFQRGLRDVLQQLQGKAGFSFHMDSGCSGFHMDESVEIVEMGLIAGWLLMGFLSVGTDECFSEWNQAMTKLSDTQRKQVMDKMLWGEIFETVAVCCPLEVRDTHSVTDRNDQQLHKQVKKASPEDCDETFEDLSVVEALKESGKDVKVTVIKVRGIFLWIGQILKAIAYMNRKYRAMKLCYWEDEFKSTLQLYWVIGSQLLLKIDSGSSLTKKEGQQLTCTTADIFWLVPFDVFVILFFMGLLLPVFLKLFPSMLPSTFHDKRKKQEVLEIRLNARRENAHFTLDNNNRSRPVNMYKYMGISLYGENAYLHYMLSKRLTEIKKNDKMAQAEGVETLSKGEPCQACRGRGLFGLLTVKEMHRQIHDWLDLSLNQPVPSSLSIISRVFSISGKVQPVEAIQVTLSSLPDEVVDTLGITALPSEDPLADNEKASNVTKINVVLTENREETLFSVLSKAGGKAFSNMVMGYNKVDEDATTKYSVAAKNTPGVHTETTTELVASLSLVSSRRIIEVDEFIRVGFYNGWLSHLFLGNLLQGQTIGVIGAGCIGPAYAKMIEGLKMNLIYYDLYQATCLKKFVIAYGQFLKVSGKQPVTTCYLYMGIINECESSRSC